MVVRVIANNPVAPTTEKTPKGKLSSNTPSTGGATYAFEDVAFVTPAADNTIQRALELAPGDYTLYIAIAEKPSKDKKGPAPKSVVLTQPFTVPNLLAGLNPSSIILAKKIG